MQLIITIHFPNSIQTLYGTKPNDVDMSLNQDAILPIGIFSNKLLCDNQCLRLTSNFILFSP